MTKIFLVRHGTTGIDEFEQHLRDGLSQDGKDQAKKIGKRIKKEAHLVHRIYTSSMLRAIETAGLIAAPCRATIRIDKRLDEIDTVANPDVLTELKKRKTAYEKQLHILGLVQKQALSFLRQLSTRHKDETIVFVTHGNMIRGIIAAALDAKIETIAHLIVYNASVSILEYDQDADYFRLTLFNDTSHIV